MSLPSSSWLASALIYQLFVGRWHSASLIKHPFSVFSHLAALDYSPLIDLGVDTIYLLGLFDNRGPILVATESGQDLSQTPQRLPSPFALSDHTHPNPLLGSLPSLKHLISRLHHHRLRVILDFVPNHTGTAHPWVSTHPEYYQTQSGVLISEFNSDVYKLNYTNNALRREMTEVVKTLVSWGIDGLRCDMAHLIPLDFWHQLIPSIKSSHPDFVFLAEVYPDSPFDLSRLTNHLDAGFDAIYHGLLYNNLEQFFSHQSPLHHLADHLGYTLNHFPATRYLNYLANHDDPLPHRAQAHLEALLALTLFLPGTPFLYNGLLNGLSHRLAHHYFDELSEEFEETYHLHPHYLPLFTLRQSLHPRIIQLNPPSNLLTFSLTTDSGPGILALNLSPSPEPLLSLGTTFGLGLLHHSSLRTLLQPGQAEVFLTS